MPADPSFWRVRSAASEPQPDGDAQVTSAEQAARSARLLQAVDLAGGAAAAAKRAGLPYPTLKNYLRGRDLKLANAAALADACGVHLEWLAFGRGPMRLGTEPATAAAAASPPRAEPDRPHLFSSVNMDYLADAYEAALRGLAARGHHTPDPRRVMQITALLYDELLDDEARLNAGVKSD